ncbi:MAG: L-rhamnose mutarotase [Muribaculaceae bacterium]|nr:L-rhamnose mutarotase [Muribaculaceae bacterium]
MARRIIQTLDLVDDAALIEFYRNAHRNVWPEVIEGIRSVGITCMDIYEENTRLVMVLELADGVDREEAMARLADLPRQAEWEEFVGKCQVCEPGSGSGAKWRPMERIFSLDNY